MKGLGKILLLGAGALVVGYGFKTKATAERLQYRNPRIRFNKITISGIYLDVVMDITNPGGIDIAIEYFTGDILYNNSRLCSFNFDANASQTRLRAHSTTQVPFTVIISNLGAVNTLRTIITAISKGTKINTVLNVDARMYAAGFEVPVKFGYDVKTNAVSGIGSVKATLEFGNNQEMEKYFTRKRMEKKILFSKN